MSAIHDLRLDLPCRPAMADRRQIGRTIASNAENGVAFLAAAGVEDRRAPFLRL